MIFDGDAVYGGDGREGFFEVFEGVGGQAGLEVGEDAVLFFERWKGFGCLGGGK